MELFGEATALAPVGLHSSAPAAGLPLLLRASLGGGGAAVSESAKSPAMSVALPRVKRMTPRVDMASNSSKRMPALT